MAEKALACGLAEKSVGNGIGNAGLIVRAVHCSADESFGRSIHPSADSSFRIFTQSIHPSIHPPTHLSPKHAPDTSRTSQAGQSKS